MSGIMIMGLIQKGENPCWGCNHNRNDCGGCPKRPLKYSDYIKTDKEKHNNYIKKQNLKIKEEKRIKRLNNQSNELIMDISIEHGRDGMDCYINIKDRIKENVYSMKLDKDATINKACGIAIMFIEKFKIKEVHVDTVGVGQALYDCLLYNLKVCKIDWCDVIGFTYRILNFDTYINSYKNYDNKNDEPQFVKF